MNQDSKLGSRIKGQISRFASGLCAGMDKVTRRFVGEMLYGIQASKDVKVSEVARSLNETIALIKIENRLCRNLAGTELTGSINRWTCWEGAGDVDDETVLAIDLGDVRKPCAKKMEYLGGIRDGSTPLARGDSRTGVASILLLTNVPPPKDRAHGVWIADVYLTLWKCEEAYRFLKQGYNLEDVRVRSYTALRNTYALVHAILYFVSVVIGAKAKMNLIFKKVCERAKRFYEVATFYQYAVADGIYRLLFASRTGPRTPPPRKPTGQLVLAFLRPPS